MKHRQSRADLRALPQQSIDFARPYAAPIESYLRSVPVARRPQRAAMLTNRALRDARACAIMDAKFILFIRGNAPMPPKFETLHLPPVYAIGHPAYPSAGANGYTTRATPSGAHKELVKRGVPPERAEAALYELRRGGYLTIYNERGEVIELRSPATPKE